LHAAQNDEISENSINTHAMIIPKDIAINAWQGAKTSQNQEKRGTKGVQIVDNEMIAYRIVWRNSTYFG